MPVPFIQLGNFKIAPFKYTDAMPYGAFSNTSKAFDYSIKQEIKVHQAELSFEWPSSEHAYHAQKILHLKSKLKADEPRQIALTKALYKIEQTKSKKNEEFLPQEYKEIVSDLIQSNPSLDFGKDKNEFDALCDANYHSVHSPHKGLMKNGEPYTLDFMRQVIRLKLDQHDDLKQVAIDCAKEGIMPVEVSQHDDNWASGKFGEGKNMLGLVFLELGNEYLLASKGTPQITNPKQYYDQLVKVKKTDLTHNALVDYTLKNNQSKWQISPGATQKKHQGPEESPAEYVQNRLEKHGFKGVQIRVVPDRNDSSQKVIQLIFNSTKDAENFKSKYSGKNTPASNNGTILTLGSNRAPEVFKNLGIEYYGRTHPVHTNEALINTAEKNQKPTSKDNLQEIKDAVFTAQKHYAAWYKNHNKHSRGKPGFFTWLRHGQKGQNNAIALNWNIQDPAMGQEEVVQLVNKFLTEPGTRYHRHSFASFLLDNVRHIKDSPWSGIKPDRSKLYDKNAVTSELNPGSSLSNKL